MSLGNGKGKKTETTTQTTTPQVPGFVQDQTRRVFDYANTYQPPVYEARASRQSTKTSAAISGRSAIMLATI